MRPGWNPTRRNKHAGSKAHGHGRNNELVIPQSSREPQRYFEKLTSYVVVTRAVGSRELRFLVEPTRPDWFYPCSIDDICAVLSRCSAEDLASFDFIVLRQPTRKQTILAPVWGRAIHAFDIDKFSGAAIVIEAQSMAPIIWPRSMGPESARELDRLRGDGHEVRTTRKGLEIHMTPLSMRNTVLHRTLLHELGHHVDYNRSSEVRWRSKSPIEKEDFAHRYALQLWEQLSMTGQVPFAPIIDDQAIIQDKLSFDWFCLPWRKFRQFVRNHSRVHSTRAIPRFLRRSTGLPRILRKHFPLQGEPQ